MPRAGAPRAAGLRAVRIRNPREDQPANNPRCRSLPALCRNAACGERPNRDRGVGVQGPTDCTIPRHARTEEDPGDVTQAVRIYERMKRSYEILMDPTLRKAHDERMTANVRTAGGESPPEHGV